MIHVLNVTQLMLKELEPLMREKNVFYVHPNYKDLVIEKIIKPWIAITIANVYEGDATKMAKEQKYFARFMANSLIELDKFILVTNQKI